jgi:hypothetical protein
VQLTALQEVTELANASTAAALLLIAAGTVHALETASRPYGALVKGQTLWAIKALQERAFEGIQQQLLACGETNKAAKDVEDLRKQVETAEMLVKPMSACSDDQQQREERHAIGKRNSLRTELHNALPCLRNLLQKRWQVLERCPDSLEFVATFKRRESLQLHNLEAIEALSDKKQQQRDEVEKVLERIDRLTKQVRDQDICLGEAELQEKKKLRFEDSPATQSAASGGAIVCSICNEDQATLACSQCDGKLFCGDCSAFVHRKGANKAHTPTAVGSTSSEQQSSEHYKQQLAVLKRQLEKEQHRLLELTTPHFPEWDKGVDRLTRSNLVVKRTLAGDYEVMDELGAAGGAGRGGQGVVLKVKLLGEEDSDGAIKVLKQMPRTDMKAVLSEALVPHTLQV